MDNYEALARQQFDNEYGVGAFGALATPYQNQLINALKPKTQTTQKSYSKPSSANGTSTNTAASALLDSVKQKQDILQSILNLSDQYAYSEYNNAVQLANQNSDKALKEMYVNKKLTEKNMPQLLQATGLSGGASETSAISLQNNYANNRNNIEMKRQDALVGLLGKLNEQKQKNHQEFLKGFYSV